MAARSRRSASTASTATRSSRPCAAAEIDLLLDVRQRRGVRGSEYAWANAGRLQAAMAEAGIGYTHLKELAPDHRAARAAVPRGRPARRGQALPHGPRPRVRPSLHEQILDPADLDPLVSWIGAAKAALLCVERDPEACHRSLIAARLRDEYGFGVEHLRP